MSRDEILQRFEQWLDGALAAEDPPGGIDADILRSLAAESGDEHTALERRSDAYALWATVTVLIQEVKLQGRSFKELNDTLGSQASRMAERERDLLRWFPGRTATDLYLWASQHRRVAACLPGCLGQ